ncbi:MAG: tetratricopeptide repeat protein [Planctomycetes bacterium]|nr:tetratricopeptide repeat protein [Planctomycetota bacterium]
MIVPLLVSIGCQSNRGPDAGQYQTLVDPPNRLTDTARTHNARAVELIGQANLEEAEKQLKSALAADKYFGSAHNNLGAVYFKQKKYYHAAWEFQCAAKLMPKAHAPCNNLGLLFEAAGQPDKAAEWYEKALALAPESMEVVGNLARLNVRTNQNDEQTRLLLREIMTKDHRPQWIAWAKEHLAPTDREPSSQPATQPVISLETIKNIEDEQK